MLEEDSLAPSPESFLRFVNVDQYMFAAEILPEGAGVTITAAPHPFEFKPYLFDLYPADERARRAVVDHRMRVVRIHVADLPEVAGEAYGEVRFKVDLPALRPGFPEPLLSIGPRHNGEVLYVRFLTERFFVLGVEGWGRFLFESEPQTFVPGEILEVVYFSGALLPDERKVREPGSWGKGRSLQRVRSLVRVRLGDEVVIDRIGANKAADSQLVHAAVNRVKVGSAGQRFTGRIFEVRRGGLPEMVDEAMPEWGLRIDFEMPDAASGRREPLFSLGVPGEAVIGYLIPSAGRRGRIGVEVWGIGAFESEEVSFRPGPNEVTVAVGSLFPPEGAPEWAGRSREEQRRLLGGIGIGLNGATALEVKVTTPRRPEIRRELSVGANAVGGSHVLPEFTGQILRWELSPLTGDER